MLEIFESYTLDSFYSKTEDKSFTFGIYADCFITNNGLGINVKNNCTLAQFLDKLKNAFNIDLPANCVIKDENNLVSKGHKIYIIKDKNCKSILSIYRGDFLISEKNIIDELIQEITIKCAAGEYKVCETITDLSTKSNSYDFYDPKGDSNISKKQALQLIQNILDNLLDCNFVIRNIYSKIHVMFKSVNLIKSKNYHPTISDGVITLSSTEEEYNNSKNSDMFNIILNETKEVVGDIDYSFRNNQQFYYAGNVGYQIKKQYRGKHYATKALGLLKKLLEDNEFQGDRTLYVSTAIDNIYSQKVALNNNGILIYEGIVPKEEAILFKEKTDKVKIYQLENSNNDSKY